MTSHHHEQKVPRGALVGAACLIALTIGLAAVARGAREPEVASSSADSVTVELRFVDRPDGSVAVVDAESGDQVMTVAAQSNGFVRGVLRGMFRTRKLEELDRAAAFRLTRAADGALVLDDPLSGRVVDLRSFGTTNYQAFATMFDAGLASRRNSGDVGLGGAGGRIPR